MPPTAPNDISSSKSITYFSVLPYGWIPDDGVDFFTQFIFHLKGRWLKLYNLSEEHLAMYVSCATLLPALHIELCLMDFKYSALISYVREGKALNL